MVKDEEEKPNLPMEVTPVRRFSSFFESDAETSADQFNGAFRELHDLRCQLHRAADYCENAFLKADKKKIILDSTKKYICDSVVAVIDHLGTVSSKIEHELSRTADIIQTEQKIDLLKHRLLTCQQFAIAMDLPTLRDSEIFPRNEPKYILKGERLVKRGYISREEEEAGLKTIEDSRRSRQLGLSGRYIEGSERNNQLGLSGRYREAPSIGDMSTFKLSSREERDMILPGKNGSSILLKSLFGFKVVHAFEKDNNKIARQGNNFWSFARKNKRKSKLLSIISG